MNTKILQPSMEQPTSPIPTQTPVTSFGESGADTALDPMRNFGYAVAAYTVLWSILLLFLWLSWRRQGALQDRLLDLERALATPSLGPSSKS